jgi:hypothetical protein
VKSLKRIRNRAKRCYELAFKVMLEEPGAEKFTLVHGRRYRLGIPHAWIETGDGRIYDVVDDHYYRPDEYPCSIERRYTQAEARLAMLESWHSGPWHYVIYGGYGGDTRMPIGILMERGKAEAMTPMMATHQWAFLGQCGAFQPQGRPGARQ